MCQPATIVVIPLKDILEKRAQNQENKCRACLYGTQFDDYKHKNIEKKFGCKWVKDDSIR